MSQAIKNIYPLEIRSRNNNKLLKIGKKEVVDLDNLSPDENESYVEKNVELELI